MHLERSSSGCRAHARVHLVRSPAALRLALLAACALASCTHPPLPGAPLERTGDEISVCGQLFHTGTRVVLWNDPGGYDAYRLQRRFEPPPPGGSQTPKEEVQARFGPERGNLPGDLERRVRDAGWRLEDLQRVVRMFILHYDAAGTSRQCFKILHDVRNLSVHFLLDVDGTIYQTLDLKERAWHAGEGNDASIGIEIAHIGAFASPDDGTLRNWYHTDSSGPRVRFPDWLADPGVRTPGFIARPARRELLSAVIHGETWYQYDFTDAQYQALARLTAALLAVFPRLQLQIPTDASGHVRTDVLTPGELAQWFGIIGHWHVSEAKIDPGPAFDWERLLASVREHR
jgi:N-acetyl-anhydromuramyl-L-alanine amidase AmpD